MTVLREIRNNAYLFSDARKNCGEIMVSRAGDGESEGKNIFDYLKLDRGEREFLCLSRRNDPNIPVILLGHRKGEARAVLLLGLSVFESSASVAFEMLGKPEDVLYTLLRFDDDGIAVSPSARSAGMSGIDRLGSACMADELSLNEAIAFSKLVTGCSCTAFDFFNITVAAAELVGVGLELDSLSFSNIRTPLGYVSACGFFSAAVLILAMIARKYSKYRVLNVTVSENAFIGNIKLSFDIYEMPNESVQFHLASVANSLGIPISVSVENGRFCCEFAPYRPDEGIFGVKDYRPEFIYDDFFNWE